MKETMLKKLEHIKCNFSHCREFSVYDLPAHTVQELISIIISKVNECVSSTNDFTEILTWLLDQGVKVEVIEKLEDWLKDGTLDNIINEKIFNELNGKIDSIAYLMPPPGTVEENTNNLQNYLNKANGVNNVTIKFQSGEYELNSCFINSNTTIELNDNTTLKHIPNKKYNPETGVESTLSSLFYNAIPFNDDDGLITGYNGKSNITIRGGKVYAMCFFTMLHGKNILIEGVEVKDTKASHAIQIAACKNVTIRDCSFIGSAIQNETRNYVELIQLDFMTKAGVPGWCSYHNIYDSTVNDGVTIERCNFTPASGGDFSQIYTGVGSHSYDNGKRNKNIIIRNCVFNDFSYAAATLRYMDNVVFENNKSNTKNLTDHTHVKFSSNVVIRDNTMSGGKRVAYIVEESVNVTVDNNYIKNVNGSSDCLLVGECENVSILNNSFESSNLTNYVIQVRSSNNISILNNLESNCITNSDDYLIYAYSKNNVGVDKILIKNNQTTKGLLKYKSSDVSNIICEEVEEILWSGELQSPGDIILNDSFNKFYDTKIYISSYGSIGLPFNFSYNRSIIRYTNLPDELSNENKSVSIFEIDLIKQNDLLINISKLSQLNISENGMNVPSESLINIKKITGRRLKF